MCLHSRQSLLCIQKELNFKTQLFTIKVFIMKAQLFLVLAVALSFAACQSDSDFATPGADTALSTTTGNFIDIGDDDQGLVTCMAVESRHTLNGVGRLMGSHYSGFSGPYGTYEITASGDALSDPLKDGNSILRLSYNPNTMAVIGTLTTSYKNGAQLDQKIDGAAQRQINGKSMILTIQLSSASLTVGSESYILAEGSATMTLPTEPSGMIQLQVETKGLYCTED
jgi:hypothetical protein